MKNNAFTLAEVLITLGIIGIVAAMTLPTLIQNHQKKVVATKVKKAYSEFNQALKLSEVENGEIQYWNFLTGSTNNSKTFVEKYIQPYFKDLKLCSVGGTDKSCGQPVSGSGANYITSNGTGISIVTLSTVLPVLITPNIKKNKTYKLGTDSFYFWLDKNTGKFLPNGWKDDLTREDCLNGYTINSNTNSSDTYACRATEDGKSFYRHACTSLLMLDNWEFKKDYPW